jgi:tRNA pseudouridine55 synthase
METRTQRHTAPQRDPESGEGEVLLVRKPKGWTSFDVVNKLRNVLHVRKAGHAGTLDPMATGLLIVCTGKKTKHMDQFLGLEKEYVVQMTLGARTPSYDAVTEVSERRSIEGITEEAVRETLKGFVGHQIQLPPMWSAAKVSGKRLYTYARRGETVERRPREIFIRSIELTGMEMAEVTCTVICSKGTYVRSLVDDFGLRLGCGAHVSALERTRIGEFRLADALTIEEIATRHQNTLHSSV